MPLLTGSLGEGRERAILMDAVSNAIITLPNNHSYIHKGQHFKAAVSGQPTDVDATLSIAITTPPDVPEVSAYDELYHLVWRGWSAGPFSLGVYEDVTSYTGGSAQTPMNNDRRSSYTTDLVVEAGTNIVRTGGNLILPVHYYGAASMGGSADQGLDSRDDDEILLKADSIYVFELTSLTSDTVGAGIEVAWYEYVPEL